MTERRAASGRDKATVYEIRAKGVLDESWSDSVGGMDIVTRQGDGGFLTVLTGDLPDQAALSGVLNLLYDLGLTLITVETLDEPDPVEDSDKSGGANSTIM